jgi:putative long chain acyl-CoA synthase
VLELYASTEGTAVLANASGAKIGAVGRPLPGSSELALVAYDFAAEAYARGADGRHVRCGVDEPGVLIAHVPSAYPTRTDRIHHDVFEPGDTWYFTGDVLRRDADGDYWFVDRLVNFIRTAAGPVSSVEVEQALYQLPEIELAVAYGVAEEGERHAIPVATVSLRAGAALDRRALLAVVDQDLPAHARPRVVRCVERIEMTDGFRPLKAPLRRAGTTGDGALAVLRYDQGYGAAPGEGDGGPG